MASIPFDTFGSSEDTIHFAGANGFPPGVYTQFLNALGEQYRVLAIHHRPIWDESDPWETLHDWKPIGNDLIRFLDEHGIQNAIGIGHSLGGVATLYAALERPDLFRKIILIEPVFLPRTVLKAVPARVMKSMAPINPMVKGALRRRHRWDSLHEAWERFRGKPHFGRFSDQSLWDYVHHATHPHAEGGFHLRWPRDWEARFYSMPPRDVYDVLPDLKHPTLGIRGADTDTLHPGPWKLWQNLQPHASFVEVPETGHLLTMEEPAKLAKIVLDWLDAE